MLGTLRTALRRTLVASLALTAATLAAPAVAQTPTARTAPVDKPVIGVIGDSYTAGTAAGGAGSAGWPAQVQRRLGGPVSWYAEGGIGYVHHEAGQPTFASLARDLVAGWRGDALIVFGSSNDLPESPAEVRSTATSTLRYLKANLPGTTIIAVGPAWPTQEEQVTAHPARIAMATRQAAIAAGVDYVNPQRQPWFGPRNAELIGADGTHPTDAGHDLFTRKMIRALDRFGVIDR